MHFGASFLLFLSFCACVSQVTSLPGRWSKFMLYENKKFNLADVGFSPIHLHSIVFGVQACEELMITFSELLDNSKGYVMVYIGYQHDNFTLLIPSTHCGDNGKCTPTDFVEGNFLDCDHARYFWMKWDNHGILELGKGWIIGQELFLHTNYSGEFNLNSVTFEIKHPAGAIAVINVDTRPKFIAPSSDGTHSIVVEETRQTGVDIFTLKAKDPENDNITFSVVGDFADMFNITGNKFYNIQPLDFETRCSFDVTISASDNAGVANTTLTVRIGDVYDETPQLYVSPVGIPEELAIGTAVDGGFVVRDQDINDTERFILTGPHADYFNILSDWKFEIRKRIDFENGSSFLDQLVLTVIDSAGLNTSAELNITILNMNDNPPIFSDPVYYASVTENTPDDGLITITCTDADSGLNGGINITLTTDYEDSNGRVFNFDSSKQKVIALSSKIDYESLSDRNYTYVLTLMAVDTPASDIPNTAYAAVVVTVLPQNDNAPLWNQTIDDIELSETLPAGTFVTTFAATDDDHGPDGDIFYSITSIRLDEKGGTEVPGMFAIDSCSGNITVAGDLDIDPDTGGVPLYYVTIQAADGGNPPKTITKTVKINLKAENDNAPEFTDADNSVTIAENVKVGDKVYTFTVVDKDDNNSLSYSLSGEGKDVFEIQNSDIITKATLDYETKSCYFVVINVTDGDNTVTKALAVSVEDVIDEMPTITVFPQISIPEKLPVGTPLGKFYEVIDRDFNDTLTYNLTGADQKYFKINPDEGTLSIAQVIDRYSDATKFDDLSLTVTDSGGKEVTVKLPINITVVTDNSPNCSADLKVVNLTENTAAETVLSTVSCVGVNGDSGVILNLVSGDDAIGRFDTKGNTLITSSNPIDYEALPFGMTFFTLVLEATDSPGSYSNATIVVTVQIIGLNEHTPVLDGVTSPLTVKIREDVGSGKAITQVNATDQDAGPDGVVMFKVKEVKDDSGKLAAGMFRIDPFTGIFTAIRSLDRDTETGGVAFYNVTVAAYDQGNSSLEVALQMDVIIENVNDNTPYFVNFKRQENVAENASVGDVVANLIGTDVDGDNLTYSLVGGDSDYFIIDGTSIKLQKMLDFEKQSYSYVLINLSDGKFDFNETLVVTVTDVIDEPPQITILNSTDILEELPIGTLIGAVYHVTDADKGDNLKYSLTGAHSSYFSIDNTTGDIRMKSRLDADSLQTSYLDNLTLQVEDQAGLNDSQTLRLNIVDVDDNSPTFSMTLYTVNVTENSTTDLVVTLNCTDPDVGKNGEFIVSVESGDADNIFNITGMDLIVPGNIDYESLEGQHYKYILTLKATATGGADDPKSGAAIVIIQVLPANEFTPQWNQSLTNGTNRLQDITIYENVTQGTVIGTFAATDDDAGNDGVMKYTIMSIVSDAGNYSNGTFKVDRSTGEVRVTDVLDRDNATGGVSYYNVTLQVEDTGPVPRSNQAEFTIILLNTNDNVPSLDLSNKEIRVDENTDVGEAFFNLTASDNDEDRVTFFVSGKTVNRISIQNDSLVLLEKLDYEEETCLTVIVIMSDGLNNVSETLVIKVADVIDEPPILVISTQSQTSGNLPVGTVLGGLFGVSDKDKGDNLTYSLSGNQSSYLEINTTNGEIRFRKNLGSLGSPYLDQVTLRVEDQAGLSDTQQLNISVITVSDNGPTFSQPLYVVNITENTQNVTLVTLNFTDPDAVQSGDVIISVVSGDDGNVFSVNGLDLIVSGNVDYESLEEQDYKYILTLKATPTGAGNGGDSSNGGTAAIVIVKSENEFSPVWDLSLSNSTIGNLSVGAENVTEISIFENESIGNIIASLTATDSDSGDDGIVTYSILSTLSSQDRDLEIPIAIDAMTGELRISNNLDRDLATGGVEYYSLLIQAQDGGQFPNTITRNVTITLINVNDNPPILDPLTSLVRVSENVSVGSNIYTFPSGSDIDGDLVIFSVLGGYDAYFQVINGSLFVMKELDYENTTVHSLLVNVTDGKFNSNMSVTVYVDDVIDETPVVTIFEPVNIQEELGVNTTLGGIFSVKDKDESDSLTFSLQGNDSRYLRFNPATKELQIAERINRDGPTGVVRLTNITLTVTDSSGLSTSKTFSVDIVDIDDNPPVFSQIYYYATVDENSTYANILNLSLTDVDMASDDSLILNIEDGNSESLFNVTNAMLYVDGARLDYETSTLKGNTYMLTVTTNGGTMTGTTVVVVDVQPKNEFTPSWITPIDLQGYFPNVTVFENVTVGSEICTLKANDSDKGDDGSLMYKIINAENSKLSKFNLDDRTGVLRLSGLLDYDVGTGGSDVYEISIKASDKGYPPLTIEGKVRILVLNTNDNAPTVTSSVRSIRVLENASIDDELLTIPTVDKDGDTVTLSIVDGNDIIEIKGSALILKMAVNDIPGSCPTIILRASDGELYNDYSYLIQVTNVNVDEAKIKFATSFSIPEEIPPGTVLGGLFTVISDGGSTLQFTIEENGTNFLEMDYKTGEVTVKDRIDRDGVNGITSLNDVIIAVSDNLGRVTRQTINIDITDINDNVPTFNQSIYSALVKENSQDGPVLTISCDDLDSAQNGLFVLSLRGDTHNGLVSLAGNSVNVKAKSLDYDTLSSDATSFTLTLEAVDQSSDIRFTSQATLFIQIEPVNEFTPSIADPAIKVQVKEDTGVGSLLYRLNATDDDRGVDGQLTYTLISVLDDATYDALDKFEVHPSTGELRLLVGLDTDTSTGGVSSYVVTYKVNDGGVPSKETQGQITLSLVPVNEHTPKLKPSRDTIDIKEDAAMSFVAYTFAADDADGDNVTFSVSGNLFRFKGSDLTLSQKLDFDTDNCKLFTVSATDGKFTTSVSFSLNVIKANVTGVAAPKIWALSSPTILEEQPVGTIVSLFQSVDGGNPPLLYSLSGEHSDFFSIDSSTGKIKLAKLVDYDGLNGTKVLDQVTLTVNDSTQLQDWVTFNIAVIDLNDNSPRCANTTYSIKVAENSGKGQEVCSLDCHDNDGRTFGLFNAVIARNGVLDSFFTISDMKIFTSEVVADLEAISNGTSNMIQVILTDNPNGNVHLSTTVFIAVQIIPMNEYAPVWNSADMVNNSTFADITVFENVTIGTVVAVVTAIDMDAGEDGVVSYELKSVITESGDDVTGQFSLDSESGSLRIATILDADTGLNTSATYNILIVAKDQGVRPNSIEGSVKLIVVNINDNPPTLGSTEQQISIYENASIGDVIYSLQASDVDGDTVTFKVIGDLLNVDESNLLLNKTLDFEKERCMTVEIIAMDDLFSVKSAIIINVLNINDETPVIQTNGIIGILEEQPIGTLVAGAFVVTDRDEDDTLTYSLDGNNSLFDINSTTGQLMIKQTVDFEQTLNVTDLRSTLRVTDDAGHVASANLVFSVSDINDNTPVCSRQMYEVNVTENVDDNTTVLTLQCSDADGGSNGEITLAITKGNEDNTFSVSGLSLTIGEIDYDGLGDMDFTYTLTVAVSDNSTNEARRTAYVVVVVNVLPKNEFDPYWMYPVLHDDGQFPSLSVQENTSVGTVIQTYAAGDLDEGSDGQIKYSITSVVSDTGVNSMNLFSIDKSTGSLVTSSALDYDVTTGGSSYYNITIRAEDSATNSKYTTGLLSLALTNYNDNSPKFSKTLYSIRVTCDKSKGDLLSTLSTTDADTSELKTAINGSSRYVYVDLDNGNIKLLYTPEQFALKDVTSDIFVIVVSDRGDPELKDYATVYLVFDDCIRPTVSTTTTTTASTTTTTKEYSQEAKAVLTTVMNETSVNQERCPHGQVLELWATRTLCGVLGVGLFGLLVFHLKTSRSKTNTVPDSAEPKRNQVGEMSLLERGRTSDRKMRIEDMWSSELEAPGCRRDPMLSSCAPLDHPKLKYNHQRI